MHMYLSQMQITMVNLIYDVTNFNKTKSVYKLNQQSDVSPPFNTPGKLEINIFKHTIFSYTPTPSLI